MATIVNHKDVLLQATSPRVPYNGVGDIEWADVLDTAGTKPTNNADVTSANTAAAIAGQGALAVLNAVDTAQIVSNAITAAKTSLAAINSSTGNLNANTVAASQIVANSITSTEIYSGYIYTNTLNASQVNAGTFTGVNIDLTGSAKFNGATSIGGNSFAGSFNSSFLRTNGLYCASNNSSGGTALTAIGVASNSTGILANANSSGGIAIHANAYNATAKAAQFSNSSGGTALVASGTIAIHCNGHMQKTGTTVVTNLNADMLDGYEGSEFVRGLYAEHNATTALPASGGVAFMNGATGYGFDASAGGTIWIVTVSDRRRKTNIQPETLGLDFVRKLKPCTFERKDSLGLIRRGFIAQDLGELLGTKVGEDALYAGTEDDLQSDYINLISPITFSIHQMADTIDKMQERLNKQDKHIKKLIKAKK